MKIILDCREKDLITLIRTMVYEFGLEIEVKQLPLGDIIIANGEQQLVIIERKSANIISLVNAILGSARSAELNGYAKIDYITSDNDLIIQIASDVDIAGIQLALLNDTQVDILEKNKNQHHLSSY